MLSFDHLKTGAAVTRRTAKANPLETLVQLIEADPTADDTRLFRKWLDVVDADDDQRRAALHHTFKNYMTALERDRRKPKASTASRLTTAQRSEAVAEIKAKAASILLLDLVMPNGKKARYCKGTEVVRFGGKWVEAGKKAGKDMLGKVFNESQLRKLMA